MFLVSDLDHDEAGTALVGGGKVDSRLPARDIKALDCTSTGDADEGGGEGEGGLHVGVDDE